MGSIPAFFRFREMFPPVKTLLLGVGGYFGYHFFLFYAFRYAPTIEANLINYLWPVIMVLITPLFFSEQKLRYYHYLGGVFAVLGSLFLVMGKTEKFHSDHLIGYGLAFMAALTWPLYSVGKKKFPPTSVWAIGSFCLVSGILSFITHALIEPRVVLQSRDAILLFFMGVGPFGIAFYSWDLALRHGDSRIIGALSYLTPVLSTLGLVIFANQTLSSTTIVAMILIIGGASVGLLDFLPRKR